MPRRGENIRKRKDGRWEGRYIVGRRDDGRAVYRSVYADSYASVKQKLTQAKQSAESRAAETAKKAEGGGSPLFEDVCAQWLTSVKKTVRQSTYVKYHNICRKHLLPRLGKAPCRNLTAQKLNSLVEELRYSFKPLSDSSVRAVCTILNAILRYAAFRNYAPDLPAVSVKSEKSTQIRVLSSRDQKRLIRYLLSDTDNGKIGILICLYTGIRIGEICALRWDDIDTENKILTVNKTIQRLQYISEREFPNQSGNDRPASDSKSHKSVYTMPAKDRCKTEFDLECRNERKNECKNQCKNSHYINERKTHLQVDSPKSVHSNRMIPIPDFLCAVIEQNLDRIPGAYFLSNDLQRPVEPRTYQYRYKKYLREAGLPESNFHVLRHTFATHCVSLGFDTKTLSEILGHSNVNITLSKYVHPTMEMKREQMNRFGLQVSELWS